MTVIAFQNLEQEQIFNSTEWIQAASKDWGKDEAGVEDFILWGYCEYTIQNKNATVEIRVLIDGTERAYEKFCPKNAGDYKSFTPIGLISVGLGIHYIDLEVKGSSLDAITIRRIRLLVMKH